MNYQTILIDVSTAPDFDPTQYPAQVVFMRSICVSSPQMQKPVLYQAGTLERMPREHFEFLKERLALRKIYGAMLDVTPTRILLAVRFALLHMQLQNMPLPPPMRANVTRTVEPGVNPFA